MKPDTKQDPAQFEPQTIADLIGPARTIAEKAIAHARWLREKQEPRLKLLFYGDPGVRAPSAPRPLDMLPGGYVALPHHR